MLSWLCRKYLCRALKDLSSVVDAFFLSVQICKGALECDVYMCTQDYIEELETNLDLKRILGDLFPHRRRMVFDDFLPPLRKFSSETVCDNSTNDGLESKIIVGQVSMLYYPKAQNTQMI